MGSGRRKVIDVELRDDLLDRLREFPARLQTAIEGVDDSILTRAGPGGSWGAVEVFCHLRDWDEIYASRFERIIHETVPAIPPVDNSLWAIQRDYHLHDPRAALVEFAQRRAALVTHLTRSIRPNGNGSASTTAMAAARSPGSPSASQTTTRNTSNSCGRRSTERATVTRCSQSNVTRYLLESPLTQLMQGRVNWVAVHNLSRQKLSSVVQH